MTPAIEVHDLSYRYAQSADALNSITFRVEPGECLGIVGPNGAGKSTLLQHFNGLLPDDHFESGTGVTVLGQPITRQTLPEIRRQVGLLFQDPNDQLFCPTVFEDVAFGPRKWASPNPTSNPASLTASPRWASPASKTACPTA